MPQIFIFTGSTGKARAHFKSSVEDGIPLDLLLPHIAAAEVRKALRNAYQDGRAYCWAGRSSGSDLRFWKRMDEGDLILGYQQKRVRSVAHFVARYQSEALANAAWPDTVTEPYDLVYFFSKPSIVDKPLSGLAPYFGKSYQGLSRVSGSARAIKDFGSLESFAVNKLGLGSMPQRAEPRALPEEVDIDLAIADAAGSEGRRLLKQHLIRERKPGFVRRAKVYWLRSDCDLRCRCCDFSFRETYGDHGADFIEAHHIVPLAEAGDGEREVKVKDLAPVCSNCHRMLHRNGGKSIEWLRNLLRRG
jgi:hypothetical protein